MVAEWSRVNNMQLHEHTFEVLNYTLNRSNMLRNLPFTAELLSYSTSDGHVIAPKELVRDLGVLMSSDCSWAPHINNMIKEASKTASCVLRFSGTDLST